jgi:hypothetical protein
MKIPLIGATILLGLMMASRADAASILYSTTDLGTGYQLQSRASGQVYGVAGLLGVDYAFDKSPVTSINLGPDYFGNGEYQMLSMQNGTYQVGYNNFHSPGVGVFLYPTFEGAYSGWFIRPGGYPPSPVSDINSQGQVVGTSLYASGQTNTYAAFSDVNDNAHNVAADTSVKDNLNNYIATIPGVSLTSALKIDDLGRIVAVGDNGHDYLLTPSALGPAATVPEPSTAMMFGVVGSFLGLRSIRRRWSR